MKTRHKLGTIHGPHHDEDVFLTLDRLQVLLEEAGLWQEANA
jgi:hypothetical protein